MDKFIQPTLSQKFALIRPAKGGVGWDADLSATEVIEKLDKADFWEVCELSKKVLSNVIKGIRKDKKLRKDLRDDIAKCLGVEVPKAKKPKKAKAKAKAKKAEGRRDEFSAKIAALEAQIRELKAML